jgi:hypothetical protein
MSRDLREALKLIDPMRAGASTEPATTPSSRARLERIMSVSTVERPKAGLAPSRRPRWIVAAAAVAVAAIATTGIFMAGGGDDPEPLAVAPLQLTASPSDAFASCLPVSAEYLADAPVAFEGTVTTVEGDTVTLAVEHWFTDGTASEAIITAPAGLEALIAGFDLEEGGRYLISAHDGVINYCGFSGAATPELRTVFEAAFPAA